MKIILLEQAKIWQTGQNGLLQFAEKIILQKEVPPFINKKLIFIEYSVN